MSSRVLMRLVRQHNQIASRLLQSSVTTVNYSFKSSISLDKLYPESSLLISKSPAVPQNEETKFSGYIPMDKLDISYSRSSGPGGQNTNKLNTKVNIRFKLDDATWIPDIVRNNMKNKFKNQLTKEGYLNVQSDRTRYQHMNTADVMEKIREMIRASEPEDIKPLSLENQEKLRRLREKSARERLLQKRSRSFTKSSRGAV